MEQNQFRIGGCYKQKNGVVVRLVNRAVDPRLALAERVFSPPGGWLNSGGARRLSDGRYPGAISNDEYGCHLLPGEVNERGEPIETAPETLESLVAQITPENRHEVVWSADPKRAPLPYFTERASSDRFPGFTVKSSTTEQPRERVFCDSPDMLPASHQVAPGFGSAALVVKG